MCAHLIIPGACFIKWTLLGPGLGQFHVQSTCFNFQKQISTNISHILYNLTRFNFPPKKSTPTISHISFAWSGSFPCPTSHILVSEKKPSPTYLIFLFPRWLLVLMDGCLYIYSELDTESPARGGSHRNTSILIITGRVTLIVQAYQSGWEEMENLRGNLRGNNLE